MNTSFSSSASSSVETLIVGALALDSISKLKTDDLYDSNPGSTKLSIGGVGHNIALASHYCNTNPHASRLVLIISDDYIGHTILNELKLDKSGILVDKTNDHKSASYTSIHSPNGELIIACADMQIIETDFIEHIKSQIDQCGPQTVVLDCNLSAGVIQEVVRYCSSHESLKVVIEPTSMNKSKTLGQIDIPLGVVNLITPTRNELNAIYDSFDANGKFENEEWFNHLDQLELNQIANMVLPPKVKELYNNGYIQKCSKLLPYFSHILLKLGPDGVLSMGTNTNPLFTTNTNQNGCEKFHIEYYPIPPQNHNLPVVNVTGAGDTFLGYLITHMDMEKNTLINNAQVASGLSICHSEAISPQIRTI